MTRTVLSHYVRWPAAWLAALLLLAAPLPAVAQSVELLQDHAGVLALPQRQHIESVQANLLQRWQTPLALVTLQQMGSAQANSRLSQLNSQLYQHPDVGSAMVLVWDAQHNDILMSFGPDWADAEMSQALLAAAALFEPYKGQTQSQQALAEVVQRVAAHARARQSYWQRFLLLQGDALQSFAGQIMRLDYRLVFSALGLSVLLLFVLELLLPWRRQQKHLRPQLGLDLFYTFAQKPLFYALLGTALVGISDFLFRDMLLGSFGLDNWVAIELNNLPQWSQYLLLFLLVDFLGYWGHRVLHASNVLWRLHQVHHSTMQIDVFNGIRQHIGEDLFYRMFQYLPLGLFGFSVTETFWVALVQSFFSSFTHANVRLKLGPLKYLFNNPELHIWHHSRIEGRGNVNFGDALSCWDFIFGTGYAPREEQGITEEFDGSDLQLGFDGVEQYPRGYFGQLVAPFKPAQRKLPVTD